MSVQRSGDNLLRHSTITILRPPHMRYAFVIDQSRCIGCHACSLACKAEHDVPIGSYRTWVKYVEKGAFPDVRRFFTVLRCNHCDDAPCMTICPVTALFRRSNGIVDFDREVCIGCKACMQACPYDALYIHPDHGTAEKCNFCAHRVENEMEPPCATVCPTEAIIVGDMDDPASRVSQLIATKEVSVRKPEKGTRPKVFYIEGEPSALTPGMADPTAGYLWADRRSVETPTYLTTRFDPDNGLTTSSESAEWHSDGTTSGTEEPTSNVDLNIPETSGTPPADWLSSELPPAAAAQALAATAMQDKADFYTGAWAGLAPTRTVYDVEHDEAPWGWKVSAYLWTKSVAAGAFLVAALAPWMGIQEGPVTVAAPLVGLLFLAITGALLVADLKRPSRFWTILTRPNWDSWLARGAFIIAAFGALAMTWSVTVFAAAHLGYEPSPLVLHLIRWPLVAAALATAGYSGYLFTQAKGRDFWQNPLLPLHLSVQALAAGAGVVMLLLSHSSDHNHNLPLFLAAALVAHLGLIAFDEIAVAPATRDGAEAARTMIRGRYAKFFWAGIAFTVVSVGCAIGGGPIGSPAVFSGLTSLAGLALYEHAWNLAGQAPPLS